MRGAPISSTNQANWPPPNEGAVSTRKTGQGQELDLRPPKGGQCYVYVCVCVCAVIVFWVCCFFFFYLFLPSLVFYSPTYSLIITFILQAAGMARLDFHNPNPSVPPASDSREQAILSFFYSYRCSMQYVCMCVYTP